MKLSNLLKKIFSPFIKLTRKLADAERKHRGKSKTSHVPFRLNFLFFVIFTLFAILVGRLAYLQIDQKEALTKELDASTSVTVTGSTPRGMIYDAEGNALVSNQSNAAIIYTRGNNTEAADIYQLANRLNELIDMPVNEDLTSRDKKDYYLADPEHLEEAQNNLTNRQKVQSTSDQYSEMVKNVTDEQIDFNEEELKAATIFTNMNAATALNTVFVKNEGVTDEELAVISENASSLNGVSTGWDWSRSYSSNLDSSLRSILGTVSTEKEGLPADEVDEYLKKGYSLNDRVGQSYLEKEYESELQGKKSKTKVNLDKQGNVKSTEEINSGSKGNNLKLTINSTFQQKVEEIVERNYQTLISNGDAQYSPGVYVVVTDPNNGDILSMVGYSHKAGSSDLDEYALGTVNDFFEPGSVVKGATVTAGYEQGVITGNDTLIDEPIKLAGTAIKGSIYNRTSIGNQISTNTVKALEWSSNAYMMKLVLRMLGVEYSYNMTLPQIASTKAAYDKLRNSFAEYGLGVKTGIDLPSEDTGIVRQNFGESTGPGGGNLLDLSFGQYDTYSALQLAQYAATVANGGTRISPHLVSGIYDNSSDGGLGDLEKEITGEALNNVNISAEQMAIIRQGFYQVVHGSDPNTTGTSLRTAALDMSAKTGTAETSVTVNGEVINTINSNLVAYAPSDNPTVSLSVVIPQLTSSHDSTAQTIGREIIDAYAAQFGATQ
ncbi:MULTISPECIES: peptidoglycan D,D-transpeptidase FtsI family protein [Enterococcus]|uniref:Penicillin-binding protein 2 n=1 Tax=Enterococcus alishanensis TaxID=1303817 RepID=A0ABS6TAK8_9ENTE|nr:penicillin-binding protein 2 [Enterococcus alishanensis]MBV7389928.1 penicillin-binding protein 2 [Enterococcus alishanensis]